MAQELPGDVDPGSPAAQPAWAAGGVLLVVGSILPTLLAIFYFFLTEGWSPGWQRAAVVASKALQFSLPIAWWFLTAQAARQLLAGTTPDRHVGAHPRRKLACGSWRGWIEGVAFGLVGAGVIVGSYYLWRIDSPAVGEAGQRVAAFLARNGISTVWQYVGVACLYSLVHAGLEEIYWRWFIFGGMVPLLGFGRGVVLASAAFTAHHVVILGVYLGWGSMGQILCSLAVFVGGFYWCLLFWRTKSVLPPWVSHIIVDVAIFAVGYDLVRLWIGTGPSSG